MTLNRTPGLRGVSRRRRRRARIYSHVSLGHSGFSESGDENLVVLVHKVKATVVWDEGGNLLTVLDELHTDACFQT